MDAMFVHLSDMHITESRSIDLLIVEKIQKVIISESVDCDNVIFMISGDIAQSGKECEYITSLEFFEMLTECTKSKLVHYVFCPGNHDKDFSHDESIHDSVVDSLKVDETVCAEKINFFENFFKDYHAFISTFAETKNCTTTKFGNFTRYDFLLNERNIVIDSFNSALCAKKGCNPATLYFPMQNLPSRANGDINICMMHNTENWINHADRRGFRKKVAQNYDMLFTGHEHASYGKEEISEENGRTLMFEGGALFSSEPNFRPEFNVVKVNFSNSTVVFKSYYYDGELFRNRAEKNFGLGNSLSCVMIGGKNTEIFEDVLREKSEAGAPYRHPTKSELLIDDIFVYPHVRSLKYQKSKNALKLISMDDVAKEPGNYLFMGTEKSGKSFCCKKLFLDAIRDKKIPVLVKFSEGIKLKTTVDVEKEILSAAKKTYRLFDEDAFNQDSSKNRVVIIDDFHFLKLPLANKCRVLFDLADKYEELFIFCDDSAQFDSMLYTSDGDKSFSERFSVYSIEQFGYAKRDELIRKWHSDCCEYDEGALCSVERTIENSRQILQAVNKNGFVPSYPFFLYTALSSFSNSTLDVRIEESKYGHFFSILLGFAVGTLTKKTDEIDLYLNYLTEFAFLLYSKNVSYVSEAEYWEFHKWYVDEFSLSKQYGDMLEKLKKAQLLKCKDDIVFFKYKYFYFYFLAKYLTASLASDETKNTIKLFCDNLHQELSSNVLMFLIFLSKDRSIIDQLLLKAQATLSECPPVDFKNGIEFIDSLVNELPKLTYDIAEDSMALKKSLLSYADTVDPLPASSSYSGECISQLDRNSNQNCDSSEFSIDKIGDVFKTVEIIGQIMRNYHGSLRTPLKKSLCREAYGLALRGVAYFFDLLLRKREGLVDELAKILEKISPEQKEKRINAARKFLFGIASVVAFGFIVKCSTSLGSEDLVKTFDDILKESDEDEINIAVHLIDISIKFDQQHSTPVEDAKKLIKLAHKNNVALAVLQWLALRHLRTFPLETPVRQKLCSAVGISIQQITLERAARL